MHVDDETGFLESTKQILEMKAPLRVYVAASVGEAKEILKTKKVDVIVSDYQMPEENGLEFLKELRETNIEIPFILFTGRGREEVAIEALNIGADGYFNKFGKPATVYGQLMHAIFSCVKAKRAEGDVFKFKTISDRAGYGVMLFNLDGTVLYVNEALAKMHGYAINELVGKNYSLIHTKDAHMRVERSMQELFDNGYLVMEENHLKKDGSLIPVQSNVTLIRDQKGSPSFVAIIVTDITERKESEKRIRNTLDTMLEGCQIIDYDWRYLYVNDAVAEHGRTTKENLLGKTMMEAYPGIENTEVFSVLSRCMTERTSEHMENEFGYPNGKNRWFELRIQPVPEGIFILSIDITERKEAEEILRAAGEKFETYFNLAQVMLITIDVEGNVTHINRKGCEILGYNKTEIVGNNWFSNFVPKRLRTETKAYFKKMLSGQVEPIEHHENPVLTKDGNERLIAWNNVLLRDEQGAIKSTLSSGEDITERKSYENALNWAVDELSLVNEKLTVVGKLTRHDVRNKLAVIAGNFHIAKEMLPPDHEVIKYLNKTEPALDQIVQIFDRSRTYERLGVDELSYVDVKNSCEEALSLVHDLESVTVVKDCEGLTVYADSLLGQLFYNLIDNSLKHGKKVTKIKMHYKESKDGLKLFYEDDGVGIAQSEKKKIFTEGYGKGTGIGLHMIKIMCNIYGWIIEETGKKGKGIQFTISIPKKTKDGKQAYILSTKAK